MSHVPAALTDLLADAELAAFVEASRSTTGQSARELGPLAMRTAQRSRIATRPPGPAMADVHDLTVRGGVPVRLYRPSTGPHKRPRQLHDNEARGGQESPAQHPDEARRGDFRHHHRCAAEAN